MCLQVCIYYILFTKNTFVCIYYTHVCIISSVCTLIFVLIIACMSFFNVCTGILFFFAVQAGAKKVYAIEGSNMAMHCAKLVSANNLSDKIILVAGKLKR